MIRSPLHKLVANVVVTVPPVFIMGINTVFVVEVVQPEAGVAVTVKVVPETIPLIAKVAIPVLLLLITCCVP